MKKLLYLVSFAICSMLFCFVPQISAYAVGDSWSDSQKYNYFQNNFDDINTRLNGVIINQNQLEESFEDFLQEYRDNYNIPSGTSNSTWISDNINATYKNGSSGDSDISFSETFRQAMRDWCNTYLDANTGYYYGYSFRSSDFVNYFDSADHFNAFLNVLNSNQDSIVLYNNDDTFFVIDSSENIQFLFKSQSNDFGFYNVSPTWNWSEQIGDSSNLIVKIYTWSSSGNTYSYSNDYLSSGRIWTLKSNPNSNIPNLSTRWVLSLNTQKYLIYKNLDSLKNGSLGIQDYYTVTGSYNDTISGSYNTTTNNISNTLTNSDVSNYINNYYVENGSYPTPTQVNVYITNNIDNGGGSGGGSGDDNENGSDNSNIWDFLDSIGEFIGHLISSLGEVLSGILSLLTDVIDLFIGEEGLPNVFSQLVSYYLGFLPEEFLRLIELFVVCVLIVGVIKLIRGS